MASAGGPWRPVTQAPASDLSNPLLLSDGSVIVAAGNTPHWYKLTPDETGHYENGTWRQIATLPVIGGVQYAPLYHASAVLPDGRVVIMGGEYNGSDVEVWTNLGAIYDPVADRWTALAAPPGWETVGDAQSVVLSNGTFLLASCCEDPARDALLDAKTLTWTATGAPRAGGLYQDEQGYTLLPNHRLLTLDIWTNSPKSGATNAEQYRPGPGIWVSAGSTPVSLVDPAACGKWEIGPAILRSDGTVLAFGGNTGCLPGQTLDPTAIYDVANATWRAGPDVPALCGRFGHTACTLADAPAALLPDGNILFAASAGFGETPAHFFEMTPANAIAQVSDPLFNAGVSTSYQYNFLLLPTGQVLVTDLSAIAEIYTPTGKPLPAIAPIICRAPGTVVRGIPQEIEGRQLGGRSQGAAYGDDVQAATNYPLVRIVNDATGHVFYARTFAWSTSSVAANARGSTRFTLPETVETGAGKLAVVANGVASEPVGVVVK